MSLARHSFDCRGYESTVSAHVSDRVWAYGCVIHVSTTNSLVRLRRGGPASVAGIGLARSCTSKTVDASPSIAYSDPTQVAIIKSRVQDMRPTYRRRIPGVKGGVKVVSTSRYPPKWRVQLRSHEMAHGESEFSDLVTGPRYECCVVAHAFFGPLPACTISGCLFRPSRLVLGVHVLHSRYLNVASGTAPVGSVTASPFPLV